MKRTDFIIRKNINCLSVITSPKCDYKNNPLEGDYYTVLGEDKLNELIDQYVVLYEKEAQYDDKISITELDIERMQYKVNFSSDNVLILKGESIINLILFTILLIINLVFNAYLLSKFILGIFCLIGSSCCLKGFKNSLKDQYEDKIELEKTKFSIDQLERNKDRYISKKKILNHKMEEIINILNTYRIKPLKTIDIVSKNIEYDIDLNKNLKKDSY